MESIAATAASTGRASKSSLRTGRLQDGAQRLHAGAAQQVGEPDRGVGAFELAGDVVQAAMKRAERLVPGQSEGTAADPANGLDGVDDVQNGEVFGRSGQRKPAVLAALRLHEPRANQRLHDL